MTMALAHLSLGSVWDACASTHDPQGTPSLASTAGPRGETHARQSAECDEPAPPAPEQQAPCDDSDMGGFCAAMSACATTTVEAMQLSSGSVPSRADMLAVRVSAPASTTLAPESPPPRV